MLNNDSNFQHQICDTIPPSSQQIIPSITQRPVILMNFPWTLSLDKPNNIHMHTLKHKYENTKGDNTWDQSLSKQKAYDQFLKVYSELTQHALVYILPSLGNFQDQPYVANLGVYLQHLPENRIILSNYSTPSRKGEDLAAKPFLVQLGYTLVDCPHKFAGEAELKYLGGNNYVGGYGMDTDNQAFDWMSKKFNMNIIRVKLRNSYFFHLDCSILPITRDHTLVVTDLFTPIELDELNKYTKIVAIPSHFYSHSYHSITNSVRLGNTVFTSLIPGSSQYNWLESICSQFNLKIKHVDINEFYKSGADLSCMVMSLNTPYYYN